jgi:hypothetical protein
VVLARRDRTEREWLRRVWLWAASREDSLWLDKVILFRPCRVAGVVSRLRLDPEARRIETKISDGTSTLVARWIIHFPILQLRGIPGVGLVLEGVPRMDEDGNLFMVEPEFEIVPGPDRE